MDPLWKKYKLEEKIIAILSEVPGKNDTPHFGNVFLSAYQLAIEFAKRYPKYRKDFELEKEIGGKDTGEYTSLAQYFGKSAFKEDKRKSGL